MVTFLDVTTKYSAKATKQKKTFTWLIISENFSPLWLGKLGGKASVSELILMGQLDQEKQKMGAESEMNYNPQR